MTSTSSVLAREAGSPAKEPFAQFVAGIFAFVVFYSGSAMAVSAFNSSHTSVGVLSVAVAGVSLLVFANAIRAAFRSHREGRASKLSQKGEDERLRRARMDFLVERGAEIPAGNVDEFFPVTLQAEDGLISMSQGVVNGKATMLALHQRNSELVLTGTDGQELRLLANV